MTTLKGVFPDPKPVRRKNYIQENVRNLRRMEQCFSTSKGVDDLQKLHLSKKPWSKYQYITAKVNTSFRDKRNDENNVDTAGNKKENEVHQDTCRKSSAPVLNKQGPAKNNLSKSTRENKQKRGDKKLVNKEQKLQGKVLSDPNFIHKSSKSIRYKSQGMQTVNSEQLDDLYAEGMIRYPSKKCLKQGVNKCNSSQPADTTPGDTTNILSDRGDSQISENSSRKKDSKSPEIFSSKDEVDFVKLNKERTSIANRIATQLNNNVPPTNYRKGVVPKYDIKNILETEKKHKRKYRKPKLRHQILTVQRVTSPYLTTNARKPFVC